MKLIIIQDALAPYRIDLFRRIANTKNIDLLVVILASNLRDQQWDTAEVLPRLDFPYEFLQARLITIGHRSYHIGLQLFHCLSKERPDIIISPEFSVNTLTALGYAKLHQIPLLLWWAGTSKSESNITWCKSTFRRMLTPYISLFLAYSQSACDYLTSLGIPRHRIAIPGNMTFDTTVFHRRVGERKAEALAWKESNNAVDKKILLFIGGLIPNKNFPVILKALSFLPSSRRKEIILIAVGDGPMRQEWEEMAKAFGINAIFLGHSNPSEIHFYYALADYFVHPSLVDRWGQVVSEALASALPVIVSNQSQVIEVIDHGKNGFVFPPEDPSRLAEILRLLLEKPALARSVGAAAARTVAAYDVNHAYRVFLKAIDQTIRKKREER